MMKFCSNCGNGNDDSATSCYKCGHLFGGLQGGQTEIPHPSPLASSISGTSVNPTTADIGTTNLPLNIAHFLCYIAGWISGVVFLIIEKKEKSTRFHAWQSIWTFGAFTVIWILVMILLSIFSALRLYTAIAFISTPLQILVHIAWIIVWIILIVKALQGENFKLPVVGNIAWNMAYKDQPAEGQPAAQKAQPYVEKSNLPPDTPAAKAQPAATEKFDLLPAPPAGKGMNKSQVTKFCIYCGESLPQKAMFCSRCGEKQP